MRDRVLLLRRFPYGESSLVVWGLARAAGRVHLMAKGAYRPKSATYAVLDLFDTLDLEWTPARGSDLATLRAGSIARRRRGVSRSLARYRAGLTVLELLGLAAQPDQPAAELFDAAEAALDALADDTGPPARALLIFELSYLRILGLAPALAGCAACARSAPPVSRGRVAFSAGAGGRLCRACAEEARRSGRRVGTLPERVVEAARAVLERGPAAAPTDARVLERVRDFVARFVEFHLESRPKSYQNFLAVPNRNRLRTAARS